MELKDFIKETVKDITDAINEINEELDTHGTVANPRAVQTVRGESRENIYGYMLNEGESKTKNSRRPRPVHLISFDVAVSSTEKKDGKEGIGVNVAGIRLGKDGTKEEKDSMNSRLKFSIPIALPTEKDNY